MTPLRFPALLRLSAAVAVSALAACQDPQASSLTAPDVSGPVSPTALRTVLAHVEGDDVILVNEGAWPVRVLVTDARQMPGTEATPCGTECPAIFPGQTLRIATSAVRGFNTSTSEVAVVWWTFQPDGVTRRQGERASAIVAIAAQ